MLVPRHLSLCAALSGALILSACGTSEQAATSPTGSGSTTAAAPVTVTDARGKEVTLKNGPAQRVVVLEWSEAEMALTVGANVVAIADAKGYSTWDAAEKLPQGIKDVGKRTEPSVDAIVATNPDLIIMENSPSTKGLAEQLERYVPVILARGADGTDEMARMKKDMDLIGAAVGKKDQADKAMADLEAHIAVSKKTIADAGKGGSEFLALDGWVEGSTVTIRTFAKGSLMATLGEKVGLKNAWTGKGDEQWGLATTDLEGLSVARDSKATAFYSAPTPEDDIVGSQLKDNPIWKRLAFVQQGRLVKLKPGTWTFGGPASARSIIDQYVAGVTR